MSSKTGSPEQPVEYYDKWFVKKLPTFEKEYLPRRIYVSCHATHHLVGSVLDLCCGVGQVSNMVGNREYLGVDYSKEQLDWAIAHNRNPNASFLRMDIRHMSEEVGEFDSVLLGESLEHFEDSQYIVEIAHRHARKRVVITLPTKNGSCHVWEKYDESDIRKLLGDKDRGDVTVCEPFKCLRGTDRWVAVKELWG